MTPKMWSNKNLRPDSTVKFGLLKLLPGLETLTASPKEQKVQAYSKHEEQLWQRRTMVWQSGRVETQPNNHTAMLRQLNNITNDDDDTNNNKTE
jgi:hypothetical protein